MSRRIAAALFLLLSASPDARAGGQFVGDNGSQGTQRAGAFAAKADDPSALWFNPAGFAIAGDLFYLGANLVQYEQSFRRAGVYGDDPTAAYAGDDYPVVENQAGPQPIPMIAAGLHRGRLGVGFGLMAPHGYGARSFADQVDTRAGNTAPAPQRYDTIEQRAMIILPSAAVAYDLGGGWRIGVRASVGYAQMASRKAVQGIANNAESPAQDSIVTLEARDTMVPAWAAGLHWAASPTVEVGLVYTSKITVDAVGASSTILGDALREPVPGMENYMEPVPAGTERCAPGGTREALPACLTLTLPQTATAAMRWVARDDAGAELGDIELDVKWEQWSAASDYKVVVDGVNHLLGARLEDTVIKHGFEDVWSVRLGATGLVDRWHIRGGIAYETAAAPPSWTRLDVDGNARMTGAVGVGVDLGKWRLDVGGATIVQPRRSLRDIAMDDPDDAGARVQPDIGVPLSPPDEQPHNPFNAGAYEGSYWIASLGLTRSM